MIKYIINFDGQRSEDELAIKFAKKMVYNLFEMVGMDYCCQLRFLGKEFDEDEIIDSIDKEIEEFFDCIEYINENTILHLRNFYFYDMRKCRNDEEKRNIIKCYLKKICYEVNFD